MRRISVDDKRVEAFGSVGVAAAAVARLGRVDGAGVDVLTFGPGGLLGRHPTRLWQLFLLVSGTGWVSGSDGIHERLLPGDAVLWRPGEEHESGTDDGMVAVVVQTPVSPLPDVD
jgi:quercetin dioxygenase-like cupin family protein